MRRLLFILSSEFPPGPGGIGTHAWECARHLSAHWSVKVFSPQDYTTESEVHRFNNASPVPVQRLRSGRGFVVEMPTRLRILNRAIRENRPSVLLATGGRMVWVAALLSKVHGIPMVAVGHGTEFRPSNPMGALLNRWAFRQAKVVICVSNYTASLLTGAGIRPRRLEIVPNGADDSRFCRLSRNEMEGLRQRLGIPEGHLLLTVGNVTERKGQETVIRALKSVLAEVPNTHYLMIGLPTRRKELGRLAEQLGVTAHVHFLGPQPGRQVVEVMNLCDLFLMTSVTTATGDCEGFGIAAVEAALCGKPAIVSDGSGLVEAIRHGTTGLVVGQRNVDVTASAIVRLLKDQDLRMRMGVAAQRLAESESTWGKRMVSYHSILRRLVCEATDGSGYVSTPV